MPPKIGLPKISGLTGGYVVDTRDQSASISSAKTMAKPVRLPWPISATGMASTIAPSAPMVAQAPSAAGVPPSASAAAGRTNSAPGMLKAKVSPAEPWRKPRRESAPCGLRSILPMTLLNMASRSLLGGALDGAEDARIGAATADIAIHVANDVVAARILVRRKQRRGLHDLPGLAIAALRHLQIEPGLLQRMVAVGRQALDGGDVLARHHGDRRLARAHRLAVEMHRAGAAHAGAAAVFRAGELEVLAHNPEQRRFRTGIHTGRFVIDGEGDRHHALPYAERSEGLEWIPGRDSCPKVLNLWA